MADERSLSPAGVAVLAVVVAAGLWVGLRASGPVGTGGEGAGAPPLVAPAAQLVTLPVRTLDGAVVPLNAGPAATVVMVSSETCAFCKDALAEMGRVAGGRPLPGLRVVTLEGAAAGLPMAREAGLAGLTLAGPASSSATALWTFGVQGTPTFVALDSAGRVTKTMVGYLGAAALRPWIGVMLGERGRP